DLGIASSTSSNRIDGRTVLNVSTVGDALAAVNYAAGNDSSGSPLLTAELDPAGHGLQLVDHTSGAGALTLESIDNVSSHAIVDLGFHYGAYGTGGSTLTGDSILGGADTVLLKTLAGGTGITTGTVRVQVDNQTVDVDLSGAKTLSAALSTL